MKNLLVLSVFMFSVLFVAGQTYTSISDGNWLNPTTWSPVGVPIPGNNVIINHNVVLDTDFSYTTGTITVNSVGSLNEDVAGRSFAINGGSLVINGSFSVTNFALFSGLFTNNGTSTAHLMYMEGTFDNYGTLDQIDSLANENYFYNHSNGVVNAFRFYSHGELINSGTVNATEFYNDMNLTNDGGFTVTNITNADTTVNSGSIHFYDFTNLGGFQNTGVVTGDHDFTNFGNFYHFGNFTLANNFLNADSVNHDAYFYLESLVSVGNNWYNNDHVDGNSSGQFCIQNNTGNEGTLTGNFDFCDNTPLGAGHIDYNIGTIEAGIVYCETPCASSVSDRMVTELEVKVYPNPAGDHAIFSIAGAPEEICFKLFDFSGKVCIETTECLSEFTIYSNQLKPGIYFYTIASPKGVASGKLILEK